MGATTTLPGISTVPMRMNTSAVLSIVYQIVA
jgi:hypothetical protein